MCALCLLQGRLDASVAQRDTSRYKVAPVQVEAARVEPARLVSGSSLAILSDSQFTRLNIRQSSDILRMLPGVFIHEYGGLGGIKTVSLRGATAAQSAISIDGMSLNSSQNSIVDLSLIPTGILSEVSVHDISDLSASNANAIGGTVLMHTRSLSDSVSHLRATLSYGSWNELSADIRSSFALGASYFAALGFMHRRCDGNYSFAFNNFGRTETLQRQNADLSEYQVHAQIEGSGAGVNTKSLLIATQSDRGAPGSVTQGNVGQSFARLNDQQVILIEKIKFNLDSEQALSLSLSAKLSKQVYADRSSQSIGVAFTNTFREQDWGLHLHTRRNVLSWLQAESSADLGRAALQGDLLSAGVGKSVQRINAGIGFSLSTRTLLVTNSLSLTPLVGLRFDALSDARPFLSPRAGLILQYTDILVMRLNWARAFRQPSFNELYYQNYGSTNLSAETSESVSAGFDLHLPQVASIQSTLALSTFHRYTTNQIMAVPRSPLTWSAVNIGVVEANGLETAAALSLDSIVHIRVSYTYQDVRDARSGSIHEGQRIIYTPDQLLALSAGFDVLGFRFGAQFSFVSRRYSQADNAPESLLPACTTIGCSVERRFRFAQVYASLRFSLDNLTDQQYIIIPNYPMPGRSFRLSVDVGL